MEDPLFSVIIPTYNRAEKLSRALHSLAAQQFKNFEVLICDDGSTDHTREIADRFRTQLTLQYHYASNWGGPAKPRNTGIQHASAEWICFLDSDDTWHPEKLSQMIPHLKEFDLLHHDFELINSEGKKKRLKARQLKAPVFHDLMLHGHNGCIINSGVCVRKKLLLGAGGFSEDRELISLEDADLWLRISRLTDRVKWIPQVLGNYYLDGGNITHYDHRMIIKLNHLFQLHVPFLGSDRLKRLAGYTHAYHTGRIYYMLGKMDESIFFHRKSLHSPNATLAFRSLYWIFLLSLKRLVRRRTRFIKKTADRAA